MTRARELSDGINLKNNHMVYFISTDYAITVFYNRREKYFDPDTHVPMLWFGNDIFQTLLLITLHGHC